MELKPCQDKNGYGLIISGLSELSDYLELLRFLRCFALVKGFPLKKRKTKEIKLTQSNVGCAVPIFKKDKTKAKSPKISKGKKESALLNSNKFQEWRNKKLKSSL